MKGTEAKGQVKSMSPPDPIPFPPPHRLQITTKAAFKSKTSSSSVTNQEIAKFWMQKRIAEESHFLAAIKAAARIRAHNLMEDEYKAFVESLQELDEIKENRNKHEIRAGIKDWWRKSKYAYLNQPPNCYNMAIVGSN